MSQGEGARINLMTFFFKIFTRNKKVPEESQIDPGGESQEKPRDHQEARRAGPARDQDRPEAEGWEKPPGVFQ